ncbi:MarR family transcriptional regulator [Croceibacterium soli]|nr:MarR family transcriptional regulator [Croceibacterium soli]
MASKEENRDAVAERKPGISEPAGRVGTLHRLLKLTNRLMAPFSTHLSHRYNISLNEFRLLMAIGRTGASASHELAEHTGVNAMSVSRAVATLERNGRIKVETDPSNRRRKVLRLTEEGARLYEVMRPQTQLVADYLVDGLPEADIAKLDELLGKLIARLEAQDEQGRSLFIESTKPAEDQDA